MDMDMDMDMDIRYSELPLLIDSKLPADLGRGIVFYEAIKRTDKRMQLFTFQYLGYFVRYLVK